MSITLKELSVLSGIPQVTISRALNAYPHVSERMNTRVGEAVERHGYESNILARSLVKKRTTMLAFVIPDIRISFYGEMIDLVERTAAASGLHLLAFNSFFDRIRERRILTLVRRLHVDALILVPITNCNRLVNIRTVKEIGGHVVFFDRYRSRKHSYVLLDNARAGSLAAEHLLALGHRQVAMLESSEDPMNVCVRGRREGFVETVRKHGLSFDSQYVLSMDWPQQSADADYGYALMKFHMPKILAERVTGLFTYTDGMALGAMRALREAGIRIPGEISIVGCDNLDFAAYTNPPLTTIRQPKKDMARALMEAVTGQGSLLQKEFDPVLVERNSSGRVPSMMARRRKKADEEDERDAT